MNTSVLGIPALIFLDFVFLGLVTICAALIVWITPETSDTEIIKLRFASVTFIGIMAVFIFTAVLFVAMGNQAGGQIFDRAVTSMTPLAGVILGYMFGARGRQRTAQDPPPKSRPAGAEPEDGPPPKE